MGVMMPEVYIDHETLDGLVVAGLKDMRDTMIDAFGKSSHEDSDKEYRKDIEALERVLGLYE